MEKERKEAEKRQVKQIREQAKLENRDLLHHEIVAKNTRKADRDAKNLEYRLQR